MSENEMITHLRDTIGVADVTVPTSTARNTAVKAEGLLDITNLLEFDK